MRSDYGWEDKTPFGVISVPRKLLVRGFLKQNNNIESCMWSKNFMVACK